MGNIHGPPPGVDGGLARLFEADERCVTWPLTVAVAGSMGFSGNLPGGSPASGLGGATWMVGVGPGCHFSQPLGLNNMKNWEGAGAAR